MIHLSMLLYVVTWNYLEINPALGVLIKLDFLSFPLVRCFHLLIYFLRYCIYCSDHSSFPTGRNIDIARHIGSIDPTYRNLFFSPEWEQFFDNLNDPITEGLFSFSLLSRPTFPTTLLSLLPFPFPSLSLSLLCSAILRSVPSLYLPSAPRSPSDPYQSCFVFVQASMTKF